ncbi:unnamed protein product, partial [Ectocarpus fasciculatus]
MHVGSAPELGGKAREPEVSPGGKGNDSGGSGKAAEKAPNSEPRKGAKGKDMKRRASAGGAAAVAAKPGRLAKMMSKWLYPEAKHADVGNDMEAYYDEKAKRWVFPGEDPGEAVTGPPPPPPTASQLGGGGPPGPPGAAGGGGGGGATSPPNSTPGLDANDPLAALMAPPPASVGAPRRQTMGSLPMGGGGGGGGPPPMGGGLGWAGAGSAAARAPFPAGGAKFTAFAPKAPVSAFGGG